MPMMTLNRNASLTAGMAYIVFKKNVPQNIHSSHVSAVMALGAIPCDDEDKAAVEKVFEEAPKSLVPTESDPRNAAIVAAIGKLSARSDRGDFTAAGSPHAKKLQEFTGWEITSVERDKAWEEYKAAQRDNT